MNLFVSTCAGGFCEVTPSSSAVHLQHQGLEEMKDQRGISWDAVSWWVQLSLPGSNLTLQFPTVHSSSLPSSSPAVLRPAADLGTTHWHRLFNWFPFTCEVYGKTLINIPPSLSTQLYRKADLGALVVYANTSCYYHRPSFNLQIGIHQCHCAASPFSKHILSTYCVLSARSVLPLVILLSYKDKEKGKSWDKHF